MKYKLVNNVTKEETICDKVVIDAYDYYVNDDNLHVGDWTLSTNSIAPIFLNGESLYPEMLDLPKWKKIIVTNNPHIDIPKVVDEVEDLSWKFNSLKKLDGEFLRAAFKSGYNKSQETHSNSDEDMIEFAKWIADPKLHGYCKQLYEARIRHKVSTVNELIQIWREQRPKTVYYE